MHMGEGDGGNKIDTMGLLQMVEECTDDDIERFKASLPDVSKNDFEIMSEIRKMLLATLSKLDDEKIKKLRNFSGAFLVGFHDINNLLFLIEILRNPELE